MNSGRLRRTHPPEIPDRSCLLSVTSALGRYGFGSLKAEIESGRIAGSNRLGLPELSAPFRDCALQKNCGTKDASMQDLAYSGELHGTPLSPLYCESPVTMRVGPITSSH